MRRHCRASYPKPGARCRLFAEVWPVLDEPTTDAGLAAEARTHLPTCMYCQQQVADYERLAVDIRQYFGPSGTPRYRTEEIIHDVLEGAAERTAVPRPTSPVPVAVSSRSESSAPERTHHLLSGLGTMAAVMLIVLLATTVFARYAPHRRMPALRGTPAPVLEKGAQWILEDIAMVSSSEGWAVGEASPPDAKGGTLTRALLMHYLHGTWSPIVLPIQGSLQSISMVSASDGWAVGQTYGVGALILHYNGQSWKQVPGPSNSDTARVRMLSATEGWAVGDNSILHFDGQSWQHQALPAGLGAGITHNVSLLGVSVLSPDEGWAVGFVMPILNTLSSSTTDTTLPNGIILHYSGGQWRIQQQLHHVTLNGIAMLSAHEGWIAGRTEALMPSNGQQVESVSPLLLRYSGGQWVQTSLPLRPRADTNVELGQVVMLSPTDGWIIISGQYMLHYNGILWNMITLPKAPTTHGYFLTGLSMLSAHEGWAAGALISDANQGIPDSGKTYQPTMTPILLHYLDGKWSMFGG